MVGVDVQSIDEVAESLGAHGEHYRHQLFTDRELAESEGRPEVIARNLATRFAAKEAVLKLLDPSESVPSWRSIEIRGRGVATTVVLRDEAKRIAQERGIVGVLVSVGSARGFAIATATAIASTNEGRHS